MNMFVRHREKENDIVSADRIFLRSFVISIVGALICIIALSTSTWAWFSGTIHSDTNSLEVANCKIEVIVKEVDQGSTVSTNNEGEETYDDGYVYSLAAGKTYTISLIPSGSATTCYCRMLMSDDSAYVTEQIAISEGGTGISFKLTCDTDIKVTILRRWGEAKEATDARSLWDGGDYSYNSSTKTLTSNPKP